MGPEVQQLETKIAQLCSRKFAVGVNSGTDALFLALKSLGIAPGDEVITTALSWVATANAIALTGAKPVFADINDDLNINPQAIEPLITPRTKAIMPVHYTGKVCRMNELKQIARKHRLDLIEDASQAFFAHYKHEPAGSFGKVACFSMNPMKIFAACGEAGMIVTDDDGICQRLIALRYNGTVNREECIEVSLNGRLDTIQAAVLIKRLDYLDDIIEKRRQIAAWYNELLAGIVQTPVEKPDEQDVYYTYTIKADRRDELKAFLETKGVETKIQHPILMPRQPAYKDTTRGEYPNALRLVKRILCIPAHEKLQQQDIEYVAQCIKNFYQ
ncbi:MAG: DegT/DnrJ/EryC1/StrS family aminotransferase, partial [Sedimentisphaerales bacterium]|nr:DegT/DnrJ/EryC1/StrS family aminotransferase [Sedimentisphaerales bacterium]